MALNKKMEISIPMLIAIVIAVVLTLFLQWKNEPNVDPNLNIVENTEDEETKMEKMYIEVNGHKLEVELEDNSSTRALVEKLKTEEIVVNMEDYGGFEKVGELGFSLPTEDGQMTTEPGDLLLYEGDKLALHYGSNSWSYTKLGHINKTLEELMNALGNGDVKFVLVLK